MQFNQEIDITRHAIRSYAPGKVTITLPIQLSDVNPDVENTPKLQTRTLTQSAIITPQKLISDWPPQRLEQLEKAHFDMLLNLDMEIILLGTGHVLQWPDFAIIERFAEKGIGLEVMDTSAACRTYNILMYEGRKVAAALLIYS